MTGPAPPTGPVSAKRIWKATAGALAASIVILVTLVWPLGFGIDPLSVGRLAVFSAAGPQEQGGADQLAALIAGNVIDAAPGQQHSFAVPYQSETVVIHLPANGEVEFKARMKEGDSLVYSWTSAQTLYVDMHGEPLDYPESPVVRYEELDGTAAGHGWLVAPFAGLHGWFWLNTSETDTVIELKVAGYYERIEEVYRSTQ